jgi:phage terminase large subunit-like protein
LDLETIAFYKKEIKRLSQMKYDFFKPHPKQLIFNELGKTAKERLFLAANRVGKTLVCSMEVAMHATGNYPDWWQGYRFDKPVKVWVGTVDYETLKTNLLPLYFQGDDETPALIHNSLVLRRAQLPTEDVLSTNMKDLVFVIKHQSGGKSTINFKTYNQGRKAWQASKINIIHLDEEPPFEIYTEALMRSVVTSKNMYSMVMVSCTSLMFSPFLLSFLERAETNERGEPIQVKNTPEQILNSKVHVIAGWKDVTHIPEDEKKRIIDNLPPHEVQARTTGIPSIGSGMVYPIPEELITCVPFDIPKHWGRVFGLDFGWDPSPTAVIFAAYNRDDDIVYFYDEYSKLRMTPREHSLELLKRGCDWMQGVYDPSGNQSEKNDGSKLENMYRENGFKYLTKAKNAKEEGVLKVLQLMQRGKLKIFSTLTNTLRELRMYSRKEDGDIKKGDDHLLDAMRYVVMSGLPLAISKEMYDARNTRYTQHRYSNSGGLI